MTKIQCLKVFEAIGDISVNDIFFCFCIKNQRLERAVADKLYRLIFFFCLFGLLSDIRLMLENTKRDT